MYRYGNEIDKLFTQKLCSRQLGDTEGYYKWATALASFPGSPR